MASSNPNPNRSSFPPSFHSSDPSAIANTTFVQADPSTFRAVVQRLTGASPARKSSFSSSSTSSSAAEIGPRRRPAFKLHERRPTARKLEIKLNGDTALQSPSATRVAVSGGGGESAVMVSPVSPLEYLTAAAARGSPRTPVEEEERAIMEKGFYLHPNPLSTPRGSDPPALLPLFPLHSPRDEFNNFTNTNSSSNNNNNNNNNHS